MHACVHRSPTIGSTVMVSASVHHPKKAPSSQPFVADVCSAVSVKPAPVDKASTTPCFASLHPVVLAGTAKCNSSGSPGVVPFLSFCISQCQGDALFSAASLWSRQEYMLLSPQSKSLSHTFSNVFTCSLAQGTAGSCCAEEAAILPGWWGAGGGGDPQVGPRMESSLRLRFCIQNKP